jgi:hypothetical protein
MEKPNTTKLVFPFPSTLQASLNVSEPQETKGDIGSLLKLSSISIGVGRGEDLSLQLYKGFVSSRTK